MVECSCTLEAFYCLSVLIRTIGGAAYMDVLSMAIHAFAASSLCFLTSAKDSGKKFNKSIPIPHSSLS